MLWTNLSLLPSVNGTGRGYWQTATALHDWTKSHQQYVSLQIVRVARPTVVGSGRFFSFWESIEWILFLFMPLPNALPRLALDRNCGGLRMDFGSMLGSFGQSFGGLLVILFSNSILGSILGPSGVFVQLCWIQEWHHSARCF